MKDSQWVLVSERKPEPGQTVLTLPHYRVLPFGNSVDMLEGDWSDTDFWDWDEKWNRNTQVTPYPKWWLPLPSPPNV